MEVVRALIAAQADVSTNGGKPLRVAVQNRHLAVALELMAAGATLGVPSAAATGSASPAAMAAASTSGTGGGTAADAGAASTGQSDASGAAAAAGTGTDACAAAGTAAAGQAVQSSQPPVQVHLGDLLLCAVEQCDTAAVTALLTSSARDTILEYGVRALLRAVDQADAAVVSALVAGGVDVGANSGWGLLYAAEQGLTDVARALLAVGIAKHPHHAAALCAAAKYGHAAIVIQLISASADVRANSSAALVAAAHNGHVAVAAALLDAGADPRAIRGTGLYCLMEAAVQRAAEVRRRAAEQVGGLAMACARTLIDGKGACSEGIRAPFSRFHLLCLLNQELLDMALQPMSGLDSYAAA